MFSVCSINEAKNRITEHFKDYKIDKEEVPVIKSLNRHLAQDVYAKSPVPHFNRSIVDGYAIKSKDVNGATESLPAFLKISGEVEMGEDYNSSLSDGEAIYVPTGGVIPKNADCVVMIEDTEHINNIDLFIYKKVAPKENILFKGEDIEKGVKVLERGRKIAPYDLGVLTAIGYETITVYKKIKFSVISTGDEIVEPNIVPKEGEIRDINSYTLSGEILNRDNELIDYCVVRDDRKLLKERIKKAIKNSDIVVLSGGSSVGHKDLTYQLLNEIEKNSVFVHGVSIKPGKPTIISNIQNKLVIGLPGQPASALVVFKLFIKHIEHVILGKSESHIFTINAALTKNVHSTPGRETYQMVRLVKTEDNYLAEPIYGKSGTITLISNANGYIKIPVNSEGLSANDEVKVYEL